jgi:hypothetical protein
MTICIVPLPSCTAPGQQGGAKTVEPDIAEMSFLDLIADRRVAVAVRRQGVELARTSIRKPESASPVCDYAAHPQYPTTSKSG